MDELNEDGGKLSAAGRELIDLAMAKDQPPSVDDSWGMMVSRLTVEVTGTTSPSAAGEVAVARGGRWWWIGLGAVAVAAGVVAMWPRDEAPHEAPHEAVLVAPRRLDARATTTSAVIEPATTTADVVPSRLLDDAEAALGSGDATQAMTLLTQHAQRAPTSTDAPRRMALRVRTLCAQGELQRARDEAKAFLGAHADTPWADAVRRSCALQ